MFDPIWEGRLHWVGTIILRYGLAFLFLRFGIYKFIQPNVTGVQVWTAHSLLLFWVDPVFGTPRWLGADWCDRDRHRNTHRASASSTPFVYVWQPHGRVCDVEYAEFSFYNTWPRCPWERVLDQGYHAIGSGYLVCGRSFLRLSRAVHDSRECSIPWRPSVQCRLTAR